MSLYLLVADERPQDSFGKKRWTIIEWVIRPMAELRLWQDVALDNLLTT